MKQYDIPVIILIAAENADVLTTSKLDLEDTGEGMIEPW